MNNNTLQVKFKQRLNKIDSQDYDNIQSWEIAEAFNKAQIEWCRRQLAGTNIRQEGDEMSKRRIDDLSILIERRRLKGVDISYNQTFGYFESSNFGEIYNPEVGGDYLEFKRVECAAQQCFPFVPQKVNTIYVNNTATTDGYWIPSWDLIMGGGEEVEDIEILANVPVFTFNIHDQSPTSLCCPSPIGEPPLGNPPDPCSNGWNAELNEITDWGEYGEPGCVIPMIAGGMIQTQEPWVTNMNLEPPIWYFGSGTAADGSDQEIPNGNIIISYGESGPDNVISQCQYCGLTGATILADEDILSAMCTSSNTGYLVGGPNNQIINCNGIPANVNSIPDINSMMGELEGGPYNYTGAANTWVNNSVQIFQPFLIDQGIDPCLNSGCWFNPISVEFQTFSLTNWSTTPISWEYVYNEFGDWVEPTTTNYVTEDTEITPREECYCAPGADKDKFCTKARTMTVYQSEVANVDVILRDALKNPSFDWSETFCTLEAKEKIPTIRIWRKDFYVMDPVLVYYRVPRRVQIVGSVDPYTGVTVAADIASEFKDDIIEVIIDSAVSTLAGDISDSNQMMRGEQSSEKNN